MADILFRIRDKVNATDAEANELCFKRGDVIAICPTPWAWSTAELTNPDWRILRVPQVSPDNLSDLLIGMYDQLALVPTLTRKRKSFFNGVDSFTGAARTWLNDDSRAQPIRTLDVTLAQILTFISQKPQRNRQQVIG